ncbi:peptidoglycan-binding protein [Streptomyces sp. NPDC017993]|uniref:peptidoglycan-binding protein n=1 Tax=Streptomyces sp. NPDC017993 TaxID=3365027 RepID=UPI0037907332
MSTKEKATQDTYYVVKSGDTLGAIAQHYGTTVKQLQVWNNIRDVNVIQIGQRLLVKRTQQPDPGPQGPTPGCEPFPGKAFFASMPNDPIIGRMADRLIEEGCSSYTGDPGTWWSDAHRQSYSKWQRKLGFSGADADGMPGQVSWNRLRVPIAD